MTAASGAGSSRCCWCRRIGDCGFGRVPPSPILRMTRPTWRFVRHSGPTEAKPDHVLLFIGLSIPILIFI